MMITLIQVLFLVLYLTFTSAQISPSIVGDFVKISATTGNFAGPIISGDFFGAAVAPLGDLNGDGFLDVAVGAPFDEDGAPDSGAVWILMLDANNNVREAVKISGLSGLDSRDQFGSSVANIGDVDGDGIVDLLVGAPGDDDGAPSPNPNITETNRGAVYTLFMRTNGTARAVAKLSSTTPGFVVTLDIEDNFGSSVSFLGDLDGDGRPEVAIGAPGDDDGAPSPNPNITETERGAVYIVTLNVFGGPVNVLKLSADSGNLGAVAAIGDRFGAALAPVGDLNRDGIPDLAVGAPFDDSGSPVPGQGNFGAVYILFMGADLRVASLAKISAVDGSFNGELEANNNFGLALSAVGDFDGDGVVDLAVGAPQDNDGGPFRGAVWILFLNAQGSVRFFRKISATQGGFADSLHDLTFFGYSIANVGDLNGDGVADVAVGGPLDAMFDDLGSVDQRGAIWLINLEICGDGVVTGSEECDDGNLANSDGCTSLCIIEPGFSCTRDTPSVCTPICGDFIIIPPEECEDGNTVGGDGCSSSCRLEDDNIGLSGGLLALVVVVPACCCLALAVIVAVALILQRRARQNGAHSAFFNSIEMSSQLDILENVKLGQVIGTGAFGKVYKGEWNNTDIAAKTLSSDNRSEFANELSLMLEMRHPNVLTLYGLYFHEGVPMMITEFMDRGDLLHVLQTGFELTISELFTFAQGISRGMEHLHSKNILHRDLACRNVLVATSGTKQNSLIVKIADFGLSRREENYYKTESRTLPFRWAAPELIEFGKTTTASDVWSFGVVLWEIFSRGAIPYAGMTNLQVTQRVKQGFRLNPPFGTPSKVRAIMLRCWSAEPSDRPPFKDLAQILDALAPDLISSRNEESLLQLGIVQNFPASFYDEHDEDDDDEDDDDVLDENKGPELYNNPLSIVSSSDFTRLQEQIKTLERARKKEQKRVRKLTRANEQLKRLVDPNRSKE